MMKRLLLAGGLMALLCLSACTGNTVYDHYDHTPQEGWDKVDTLQFDVPRLTGQGRYGVNVGLRTNNAFPFQSITLIVEQTIFPSGVSFADTVSCRLTDRNGVVRGQGMTYFQYRFPVSELRLSQGDSIHITVRHNMRREILPGVTDVGVDIQRLQ